MLRKPTPTLPPPLPQAECECVNAMYTADREEQLLAGNPSFVLDAIDNIDTKVRSEGLQAPSPETLALTAPHCCPSLACQRMWTYLEPIFLGHWPDGPPSTPSGCVG